jgi:hypothetical protein
MPTMRVLARIKPARIPSRGEGGERMRELTRLDVAETAEELRVEHLRAAESERAEAPAMKPSSSSR